jgi:hypothetical protein
MIFRCDAISREQTPLLLSFLDTFACKSLNDFVGCLPRSDRQCVWLLFDSVDRLDAETAAFFRALIQLSYESSKFKLVVFTHATDIACSVLRWSDSRHPIKLVEPVGCCQWKKQHLSQFNQDRHAMRISVRAGCPAVEFDHEAGDLEAQWTLGITRLDRFLRDGWVQSGAFTVSAERLALLALSDRF